MVDQFSTPGANGASLVEPPQSIAQARVDDKGRLKLPAEYLAYLKELKVDKVFITTLDRQLVQIYPMAVWKANLELLNGAGDDAEAAGDLLYAAKHYGGISEVDGQGRVLIPALLRDLLELESQPVFLDVHRQHINVATRAAHEERLNRALVGLVEKKKRFETRGLQ